MKILFLISKKDKGSLTEFCITELSLVLNNKVIIELVENVDDDLIKVINTSYDAVFLRPSYKGTWINFINIPIIMQSETPLNILNKISDKYIYATDSSFLKFYPRSYALPLALVSKVLKPVPWHDKIYDAIYLGRYSEGKNEGSIWLKWLLKRSGIPFIDKIVPTVELANCSIFSRVKDLFLKLGFQNNYYKYLWHLQHMVRNKRRDILVDDAIHAAKNGMKVCFVTDKLGASRLPDINGLEVFHDISLAKLEQLVARSKFSVVQTPFHFSMLNERFVFAIYSGAIPIYDNYPQYGPIVGDKGVYLTYNYTDKLPSVLINRNLNSLSFDGDSVILDLQKNLIEYSNPVSNRDRYFQVIYPQN